MLPPSRRVIAWLGVATLSALVPSLVVAGAQSVRATTPLPYDSAGRAASTPLGPPDTVLFVERNCPGERAESFITHGRDGTVTLDADGLTVNRLAPREPAALAPTGARGVRVRSVPGQGFLPAPAGRAVVETRHYDLGGAARGIAPIGRGRAPTVVSYFKGGPEVWCTGLATWREVVYPGIWPGHDLVVGGSAAGLTYRVESRGGAGPSGSRVGEAPSGDPAGARPFGGPEGVVPFGDPGGEAPFGRPTGALASARGANPTLGPAADAAVLAFGSIFGRPTDALASARGANPALGPAADAAVLAFGSIFGRPTGAQASVLGANPALGPTADTAVLAYGSFFGGPQDDRGLGVAVDDEGNVYLTGQGPGADTGDDDAFVAKLSADGSRLVYVTYIGGSQADAGFDVAVDAAGHAYITGYTESNQSSFPVAGGPDRTFNGVADTLLAKLGPDGSDLVYAGYLGGAGLDFGEGIAVDHDGRAFVSGVTGSDQASFPVKVGPDLSFNGEPTPDDPDLDAFVAAIVPDPTTAQVARNVAYAGYIGGREHDVGVFDLGDGDVFVTAGHIALGADGSAYVSGMTRSSQTTFPDGNGFGALPGPDRTHGGDWDAWAARVQPGGTALTWAGFVGGTAQDQGFGMAVDGEGNAYFTGMTESPSIDAVVGPDLEYGGQGDAFVAKVSADGRAFDFLGYLGGTDVDGGYGLALDPDGHVFVVGYAESAADSFPAVGGPDLTQNDVAANAGDAFVCRLRPRPDAPSPVDNYVSCGYIGGAKYDQAFWVAVDRDDAAWVVGDTESDEATFPDGDGFGAIPGIDRTAHGKTDAFLVKVAPADTSAATATPNSPPVSATPSTTPLAPATPTDLASATPDAPVTATATATHAATGTSAATDAPSAPATSSPTAATVEPSGTPPNGSTEAPIYLPAAWKGERR